MDTWEVSLYPLNKYLYHYHTGTMTRKDEGLNFRYSNAYVEMNPAFDPIGKIPEYKVCAVKVEKIS